MTRIASRAYAGRARAGAAAGTDATPRQAAGGAGPLVTGALRLGIASIFYSFLGPYINSRGALRLGIEVGGCAASADTPSGRRA